jgi:hypothetical protein
MYPKTLWMIVASLLVGGISLKAQDSPTTPAANTEKNTNRFWQATLAGGNYLVALDKITSVSRHKYILDGTLIVDEVTVDTVGQSLARFYFVTPVSAAAPSNTVADAVELGRELLDKAADHVGVNVQNMVVKKYPETSHAKSIEYRILTEAELTALFNSVHGAWESGKGRQFNGAK